MPVPPPDDGCARCGAALRGSPALGLTSRLCLRCGAVNPTVSPADLSRPVQNPDACRFCGGSGRLRAAIGWKVKDCGWCHGTGSRSYRP